ncbi:MAG: peptidyl-prolyl cis-trans isomerase, partial [Acetobacteraceae bacterium]|nr:peptidyl-prolyl cis-trans isomerase [Acetobacteraceae bacterium]
DPDLGRAVFAAKPGAVVGPVKGALGWHVLKVTKETPGTNRSFDEVKSELRTQVLAGKATDLMYDRANKVDNLLGNGTPLDEMPSDLGLVGIAGTLDAHGNTKDGDPAPIPGPPELKAALIERAFQLQKGDPPQLTEVQTPSTGGSAYYALSVEDVIPPAKRPFEDVKDKVAEDWTADQERRAAEQSAAKVLAALKSGQTMADAAAVSGRPVSHTPLITRGGQAEGVAPELQRVLFSLKKGEPTMVQTPDAFIVADPVEIQEPDPAADQGGFTQLRQAITQSIGSDLTSVFAAAVRQRANPQVNDKNFAGIVQPQ